MNWWHRAACKGMSLNLFYPAGGSFEPFEHGVFGLWGGESPKERLARRDRAACPRAQAALLSIQLFSG